MVVLARARGYLCMAPGAVARRRLGCELGSGPFECMLAADSTSKLEAGMVPSDTINGGNIPWRTPCLPSSNPCAAMPSDLEAYVRELATGLVDRNLSCSRSPGPMGDTQRGACGMEHTHLVASARTM